MTPDTLARVREYRYRTLFSASHDEYMDTPVFEIDWLLHIDDAITTEKARRQNQPQTSPAQRPAPQTPTIN